MLVRVAKTAGFCFGVRKALDAVEALLAQGATVYTLGPLIHNPQVVDALARQGVHIASSPADAPAEATLVVRSHGVSAAVEEELQRRGLSVCNATCPFVAKIHRIVSAASATGAAVIIAGDEGHPEVVGIRGHCTGPSVVIACPEDIERVSQTAVVPDQPVIMVAQTTFHKEIWESCMKTAKNIYTNLKIFDTICNATAERQREAVDLSCECDIMVIVGGRQSSNTAKLRDVCASHCPTYLVETADELQASWFAGVRTAGLTAGASTPADIIKEVLSTMSEIINVNEQDPQEIPAVEEAAQQPAAEAVGETVEAPTAESEAPAQADAPVDGADEPSAPAKSFDEMSFEEALEASLQSLSTDERVRGIVVGIAPNEVQVEVAGRKQAGYIPINELSADPNVSPEEICKVGDELELLIMRTNDQEGTIMLSKKRVDALKGWDKVVEAEETGAILEGVVTDVIKGGILVVTNGVRVFIPASHATLVRTEDLTPLLKQTVKFRIIDLNKSRRRAVGSIRLVAREARKEQEAAFWAQAEVGQQYTGVVKSLTSYGAFVDLGGVDGMIHISELSWQRIKHPSEVVKVGDTVNVYIRDLDTEKHKISLGYRKPEDNPWEIFKAQYPIGAVTTAKIVGMTTFGAFAQILPGVDGLIHISQIADHRVEKPQDELKMGQEVTVKITNVDYDKKRISLSMRALLDEGASETAADEAETEPAGE